MFTSWFCGNQQYTKCTTGTVNGSRSGVFQYRNTFNIVRIHHRNIRYFHIIYQNQRFGVTIRRTDTTTNLDSRRTTYLTGVGSDGQSRYRPLQGTAYIRDRTAIDCFVHIHGSHRTGQVHLFLCTITYYDNFIQQFRIIFQNNLHYRSCLDFLSSISHKWYLQNSTGLYI